MMTMAKQVKWLEGRVGLRADNDYHDEREGCDDDYI